LLKRTVSGITLTLLLIVMLTLAFDIRALAGEVERKVGVDLEDWIKYGEIMVSGVPPPLADREWFRIEVLHVDGTNVTGITTVHYKNGTELNVTSSVDIATGYGNLSFFIIPANLTKGDSIPAGDRGNITVDGVVTRTYAGASRKVVFANLSEPFLYAHELYWDQETGMLVEQLFLDETRGIKITYEATETNLWGPPLITVLSPENKTYTSTFIPLTFTVNEATSWIGYSLDNQANVTVTVNITLSGLPEGAHSVTVYANDTAGNIGASETVYFTVALPYSPTAAFTIIPGKGNVGESVKFDASASLLGWNGTHEMLITEYRWNFGDGNRTTTSTLIVYHSFQSAGIYYVTLTVYAPGATPETDSTTKKVTITAIPVGGYSIPIKGYTTDKPLTLYLTLVAILTASFTIAKRRKKQQN